MSMRPVAAIVPPPLSRIARQGLAPSCAAPADSSPRPRGAPSTVAVAVAAAAAAPVAVSYDTARAIATVIPVASASTITNITPSAHGGSFLGSPPVARCT